MARSLAPFWLIAGLAVPAACAGTPGQAPKTEARPAPVPLPADRGLKSVSDFQALSGAARSKALFSEAGKVIQHRRCVNCHPAGDRPLQGEPPLPHQPLVVRGPEGHGAPGLPCSACHGEANFRNMPGAPKWHLAPLSMAWEGKDLSAICAQLKDRQRNGDKSLQEIVDHMGHDELVAYGWKPPPQLQPVPGNQALFGQLMQAWLDSGAHCP